MTMMQSDCLDNQKEAYNPTIVAAGGVGGGGGPFSLILFHWSCHLNWYLEKKENDYGVILGLVGEGMDRKGWSSCFIPHYAFLLLLPFFAFGLLVQKWYINLSTQDWSLGMYVKLRCPRLSTMSVLTTWDPFFYIHCSTAFVLQKDL